MDYLCLLFCLHKYQFRFPPFFLISILLSLSLTHTLSSFRYPRHPWIAYRYNWSEHSHEFRTKLLRNCHHSLVLQHNTHSVSRHNFAHFATNSFGCCSLWCFSFGLCSASAFTVHIIISDSCLLPILQLIDNSLHLLDGHVFFNIVLVSTLYATEKLQTFQLPSSKVKVRSALPLPYTRQLNALQ